MLIAFPPVGMSPALPVTSDDKPLEDHLAQIIHFEDYQTSPKEYLNNIVCFPLTVDESLSNEAQHILQRSCSTSVTDLKIEKLLTKHQSKIWISIKATAYSIALHAIILGLPSAELGPVKYIYSTSPN